MLPWVGALTPLLRTLVLQLPKIENSDPSLIEAAIASVATHAADVLASGTRAFSCVLTVPSPDGQGHEHPVDISVDLYGNPRVSFANVPAKDANSSAAKAPSQRARSQRGAEEAELATVKARAAAERSYWQHKTSELETELATTKAAAARECRHWRQRAEEVEVELDKTRTQAAADRNQLELLEKKTAAARNGENSKDEHRFAKAKQVFAKLYHPQSVKASGEEARIRELIFKEYWPELRKIQAQS